MDLVNEAKNLNQGYVIVKKYDGKTYFHGKYARDFKVPTYAYLFFDKAKADERANQLNSTRKKCRYTVESATKFFVNDWRVEIDWYNNKATIKNPAIAIEAVIQNKRGITTPQAFKGKFLELLTKEVAIRNNRAAEEKKRLEERLNELQAQNKELTEFSKKVETFDFENFLAPYGTESETTLRVFFEAAKKQAQAQG
jgi:hypothetical protein